MRAGPSRRNCGISQPAHKRRRPCQRRVQLVEQVLKRTAKADGCATGDSTLKLLDSMTLRVRFVAQANEGPHASLESKRET
jgi:hypothetical protein